MKLSLLHTFGLLLVLSFSASCGKKESGGGGSSNANWQNPLVNNPNLSQQSQQAYASLRSWYDSATESGSSYNAVVFLKESSATQTSNSNFSFSGSICLGFWNVGNCNQQSTAPNGCFLKHANGTVTKGTPIMNGQYVQGCNIGSNAVYTKAGNADLVRAVSGNGLTLLNATQAGSVITLSYAPTGYFVPTVFFQINTSMHSLLNPTAIQENGQLTSLKFAQGY